MHGWMEGKYTGKRLVHSEADIEARVWYSKSKMDAYIQEERTQTENSEKRYKININNFKINLYKSIPNFENYDTINETRKIKLFSNFYLPIQLEICEYKEMKNEKIEYTYEKLKDKMINELEEQLNEEIGESKNIINTQINEKNIGDKLEIEVIYEVIENIGISQKIEEGKE